MKCILIGINSQYVHKNLAIYQLATYCKDIEGVEVLPFETSIKEPKDHILEKLYLLEGDIYCFSTYVWNTLMVIDIARELKKLNPQCKILLGGPEVGTPYLEYPFIDHLIVGEGESSLYKFLAAGGNGENILEEQEYVDMETLPFPYEDCLDELENKIIYYEGSRGCPFTCTYCLSGKDPLRYKSSGKVLGDIERLVEAGVKQVKFIDRTFNARKEWSLEIAEGLLRWGDKGCNFHFEVSIDNISEELLDLFIAAPDGLFQLEIGIQTIHEEVLQAIKRHNNWDKIEERVQRLLENNNIHIHTDLIAGLPLETYEMVQESFNKIYHLYGHMFQVGFLKVIPHTGIDDEKKQWGFTVREYPPYEVLETPWMSGKELFMTKWAEEGVDNFYNSSYFRQTFLYLKPYLKDPFHFFQKMGREVFYREDKLSLKDKFHFFYKQIIESFPEIDFLKVKGILSMDWHLKVPFQKGPFTEVAREEVVKGTKRVAFPFVYEWKKEEITIIEEKETTYLFNYNERKSIYAYPQIEVIVHDS